jgi:glycosyltransferase involved in cell wall biosynthesis
VVARSRREGSIKHVCSYLQAHLLNYLDLEPSVVTCHDIHQCVEDEYSFGEMSIIRLGLRGMRKADRIITISRFSQEEIARTLDYPKESIKVIYLGVDHDRYKASAKPGKLPQAFSRLVGKKIILYVGSEQPRKNLPVLLRALAVVKRERKDFVLLKAGRSQWKGARRDLVDLVGQLGLKEEVVFADYVPEDDLPLLYGAADVFVFPSLYEGFGLPPLEAMACGCPVITSNASSLPEVVGDAGIMLDPHDETGLAEAIVRVLEDEDLRQGMIARGLEQSRRFSWDVTARETIAVYRELL